MMFLIFVGGLMLFVLGFIFGLLAFKEMYSDLQERVKRQSELLDKLNQSMRRTKL